ncbi:hypothetical protein D515_01239 [Grimontia indica]|uniref:Uncharacterized protein n=1 Tax=Grimontia indica TaxID=1056512 RepID=R1IG99_9GAMM|nr:hypothetical protein D515_01239 [Grimontia indica]
MVFRSAKVILMACIAIQWVLGSSPNKLLKADYQRSAIWALVW